MKFRVEAWRCSRDVDEQIKVTEAVSEFVVIDSGSRPRPLSRVEFVDHSMKVCCGSKSNEEQIK